MGNSCQSKSNLISPDISSPEGIHPISKQNTPRKRASVFGEINADAFDKKLEELNRSSGPDVSTNSGSVRKRRESITSVVSDSSLISMEKEKQGKFQNENSREKRKNAGILRYCICFKQMLA